MRLLLVNIFALFVAFAAICQEQTDSVKVYFRVGKSQFEPAFSGNGESMDAFVDVLRKALAEDRVKELSVTGYASPEGGNNLNQRLSARRCQTIVDYLASHTSVDRSMIKVNPEGVAWKELRQLVAETPDVPYRKSILKILDNTPLWVFDKQGNIISGRKKQLMDLAGGVPFNWMMKHLFPQLRNAVGVSLVMSPAEPTVCPDSIEPAEEIEVVDVVASEPADSVVAIEPIPEPIVEEAKLHRFALKTNLLYYGALLPNLEAEWMVNKDWSVALEGDVAWWKRTERNQTYQLVVISPEVRRWIHPKDPWHGMFVGAFVGGGYYDLGRRQKGYHGEGGMAGLSFGYMWPLWRNLSMEASVGAGYMFTRYREYRPQDGHKLYLRTKNMHYFGPLKLKLSLVWRFDVCGKFRPVNEANL